jgi:peptide deformylase
MLIESTDPLLHRTAKLVTPEQILDHKNSLAPIASLLVAAIYEKSAPSISAAQLGIDCCMFAMIVDGVVKICINPEIVAASLKMELHEETCLTSPGMTLRVRRPAGVMVRYLSIEGEVITERLEGLAARIWLHEFDHCQGIYFTDRVGKLSLSMAKKRMAKKNKRNQG